MLVSLQFLYFHTIVTVALFKSRDLLAHRFLDWTRFLVIMWFFFSIFWLYSCSPYAAIRLNLFLLTNTIFLHGSNYSTILGSYIHVDFFPSISFDYSSMQDAAIKFCFSIAAIIMQSCLQMLFHNTCCLSWKLFSSIAHPQCSEHAKVQGKRPKQTPVLKLI